MMPVALVPGPMGVARPVVSVRGMRLRCAGAALRMGVVGPRLVMVPLGMVHSVSLRKVLDAAMDGGS